MSIASLITTSDPAFEFEHDQLHRTMLAALPPTSLTPILYPAQDQLVPSGWGDTDHATAHLEFAQAFPRILPGSLTGIVDISFGTPAGDLWTFVNRQLHDLARTVL